MYNFNLDNHTINMKRSHRWKPIFKNLDLDPHFNRWFTRTISINHIKKFGELLIRP